MATENHLRGRLPPRVTPVLPYCRPSRTEPTHAGSRSNPHDASPCIGNGLGPDGREPVGEYQLLRPFDYACRPRLRTRLTQGRQAWPWNPWSSGARDTHPRLATHVYILTPPASTAGSRRRFAHGGTLSYPAPTGAAASSVVCLSPATLSAQDH